MAEASGFAITSLILGILSIPIISRAFCFVFAILAIIFGITSLNEIKIKKFKGKAMAITGIILGAISIILAVYILFMMLLSL